MKFSSIIIIAATILCIHGIDSTSIQTKLQGKSRVKRFFWEGVWFPYNSCIALAVVLAIPLELKNRNVYMSFNFETNFYLPYYDVTQGLVPLPFATIDEPGVNSGSKIVGADAIITRNLNGDAEMEGENSSSSDSTEISLGNITTEGSQMRYISIESTTMASSQEDETHETAIGDVTIESTTATVLTKRPKHKKTKTKTKRHKRANREILSTLLSRKKFYRMLEHKLSTAGFDGRECLLKAICETTQHPFEEHNGVLGDIVHILFTPTTSRNEKLSESYYQAVRDGELGLCATYNTRCPNGIFDLIAQFV